METNVAVLLVAVLVGVLGGLVYVIIPPKDMRTLKNTNDKLVLLAKRAVAGGIVGFFWSPILSEVVTADGWALSWVLMTALLAILSTGYVAIDVLKAAIEARRFPGVDRG